MILIKAISQAIQALMLVTTLTFALSRREMGTYIQATLLPFSQPRQEANPPLIYWNTYRKVLGDSGVCGRNMRFMEDLKDVIFESKVGFLASGPVKNKLPGNVHAKILMLVATVLV